MTKQGTKLAAGLLAILLAGCAVGPDYRRPEPEAATQWYAVSPHEGSLTTLAQWWSQFDDPLLAELIMTAERDSPDLDQALARIVQSRAGVTAATSALAPSLGLSGNAQRSRSPLNTPPLQTLRQGALEASWEIDLFGGRRRGREAAMAREQGAQAQWHDARVSLAAEVAQEYTGLRSCEALVTVAEADLKSRQESERLSHLMVDAGMQSVADGALATAGLADAASRVEAQRADCEVSVKSLVALTGLAEPLLRAKLVQRRGVVPQPAAFYVRQVPAEVLLQRPDMVGVERNMAAASAEIGVAEAARYPRITLLGSIGFQSLTTDSASIEGRSWSIGPGIGLPIFNAGRLAADVDAARARYDEAAAAYRGKARQAVREVEQAMVRLASAQVRAGDADKAAANYDRALRAAEARWGVGSASQLELEEVRRVALASHMQRIGVQRERVSAWISLYRAIGGGWTTENLGMTTVASPEEETKNSVEKSQ